MKYAWLVLGVAACGNDVATSPDAAPPDAATAFSPGCYEVPQTGADMFASPTDFGDIAPGTLAGWDPAGRWFLTGTRVGGVSSFHFERRGSEIVVDRDGVNVGTIDDDRVFQRVVIQDETSAFIVSKRVANRQPDGSFRADRAVCDGETCRVCAAKLIRAERHDAVESDKLSLVGSLSGSTWAPGFTFNVRVAGTTAYLVRIDGLHVIDVADPANPVELGHYKRAGEQYSNDVKIVEASGGRRYAILADSPVDLVDVTVPTAPTLAGQITEEAHTLFTETRAGKTYAYFGNYDGSTPVYDVTDPAAPMRLGRYRTDGALVHDLSVANGIAYLNAWNAGLLVVDFTTPATPVLLGSWPQTPRRTSHSNWTTEAGGRKIALHGDEAYGARLDVVDLDPNSQTFMSSFATYRTRDWVSIHNIMAFGTKVYVTYYQDGVRVLDVADPTKPRLVGHFNTWDPQGPGASSAFFEGAVGLDVDLTRKLIFVADSPRGLLILRDDT